MDEKSPKTEAKILTLCSGKGGAGKTITSLGLGMLLERQTGATRVLLVDVDYHTAGLSHILSSSHGAVTEAPFSSDNFLFDVEPHHSQPPIDKTLKKLSPILRAANPGLFVVPASRKRLEKRVGDLKIGRSGGGVVHEERGLEGFDRLAITERDRGAPRLAKMLQKRLGAVRGMDFDYIIFDTHAGIDDFNLALGMLSDLVILVHEQDFVSWRTSREFEAGLVPVQPERESGRSALV